MSLISKVNVQLMQFIVALFVGLAFAMPSNASAQSCSDLHNCVSLGVVSEVRRLVDEGANVNMRNSHRRGDTPLHFAAGHKHFDIVTILLTAGADPNLKDRVFGKTPLHSAIRNVRYNTEGRIVSVLLSAGANVNLTDSSGEHSLFEALVYVIQDPNNNILKLLLSAGASVNLTNVRSESPLENAVKLNSPSQVSVLLSAGANPNLGRRNLLNIININIQDGMRLNNSTTINRANAIMTMLLGAGIRTSNAQLCNNIDRVLMNNMCISCPALQQRLGNVCYETSNSCNAKDQVLVGNNCQPCAGNTPIRVNNSCISMQQNCNNNNQILIGEECQSCSEGELRNGNICEDGITLCNRRSQIFSGGRCRLCPENEVQKGNSCECLVNQERVGNICRSTITSCNLNNQRFDGSSCVFCESNQDLVNNICIPTLDSCHAIGQIRNNGRCMRCPSNQERSGNVCITTTRSCNSNSMIFNGSTCEICSGNTPVRNGNVCEPSRFICNNNGQILSNGRCVACNTGLEPVNNVCAATINSCNSNNQIFINNSCRSCSAFEDRQENVCVITQASCNRDNQIFREGACIPCAAHENRNGNACRITQASCNNNNEILFNGICQACPADRSMRIGNICQAPPASGGDDSGGGSAFVYVGAGVAALAGLYLFTSDDVIGSYRFSPDYRYELTDNGYSYSAGARLDYEENNWNLYYTINTDHSDSHIRYATGTKYSGDFWSVVFSEEIDGDNVDYDFSLSAKVNGGNWEFAPTYRLHSRFEDFSTNWQSDTNNYLNLQGMWHNSGWVVRSSASVEWQHFGKFADNTKFNLLATWQF